MSVKIEGEEYEIQEVREIFKEFREGHDDHFLALEEHTVKVEMIWAELMEKKVKEAEESSWAATRLLWGRMKAWQEQYKKANPEEKNLAYQDALKLIEWKLEQEYEKGYKDSTLDFATDQ